MLPDTVKNVDVSISDTYKQGECSVFGEMSEADGKAYERFLKEGPQEGLTQAEIIGIYKADKQTALNMKSKSVVLGKSVEGCNTSRPTWRQSELDAASDFPDYDAQKSFINGEEVLYGTKGSVRPDYYKNGYSVDIKNYNVESASGRNNLERNIEKQYYQRIQNLPEGTKQSVMIDIRGQSISDADMSALYDDIMCRTNNEIEILFKVD